MNDVYIPLVIPLLKEKVRITIQDDDQTSITFDIKNSMDYRSIQERNAEIVQHVLDHIAHFDEQSSIKRVAVDLPQALASIDYTQGGLEIAWETSKKKLNLYYDEFCSAGVAHKVYANSFTLDDHSTISARRMVFIRSHDVGREGRVEWLGLDNDADFCDRLIKGDTLWFGDGK